MVVVLTATASDDRSEIASIEYSLDGVVWHPMTSIDGSFDSSSESAAATLTGPYVGEYTVWDVRATDTASPANQSDGTDSDGFVVAPFQPSIEPSIPAISIKMGAPRPL